jgi:hypothetical protein
MSGYQTYSLRRDVRGGTVALLATLILIAGLSHALAAGKQRTFASPEEAVKELVESARSNDSKALLEIFGSDAQSLVSSGDKVDDRKARERFVAAYDEAHNLAKESDNRAVLSVGKDEWPFPIPVVSSGGRWRFDAKAGQHELLNRRIGNNELSAIQVCLAYVDAQRDYWQLNPEKSDLLHYARKVNSTKGKRDGLYWEAKPGEDPSPLGPLVAKAQQEGYRGKASSAKRVPYHGYYYRTLTAQGPHASGGAYDYLAHGELIGGFALVAYPAQWASSGVMTFIVNHEGVVYEKNLGKNTTSIAESMKKFDPDPTWQKVRATGN